MLLEVLAVVHLSWSAAGPMPVAGRGGVLVPAQASTPKPIDAEDADKLTALMRASARGDLNATRALLGKGADPNAKSSEAGVTALMFAAYFGHAEIVKTLVAGGARIDLKDNVGAAAVDWGAVGGHPALEKLLTGPGAALNPFLNLGTMALGLADKAAGK
jgi:ankyrin repeat protein